MNLDSEFFFRGGVFFGGGSTHYEIPESGGSRRKGRVGRKAAGEGESVEFQRGLADGGKAASEWVEAGKPTTEFGEAARELAVAGRRRKGAGDYEAGFGVGVVEVLRSRVEKVDGSPEKAA